MDLKFSFGNKGSNHSVNLRLMEEKKITQMGDFQFHPQKMDSYLHN